MRLQGSALVVGGAGFIGSHLCDSLLEKGLRVICLDNFITGNRRNISHLYGNKNFKLIKSDIAGKLPISQKVEYIFHFASPASPVAYSAYPEETALANSLGTLNLLRFAVKHKSRFLFASTSEIYGDPLEHPQKETYWGNVNSFGARSCYDESKRFGESLIYVYIKKYGLDARIIRIFNTYGPRMEKDDGRVVSNFINQVLLKKPITVYGNGKQTRSFCYISDLIEGIERVMFAPKLKGGVFNLGNPEEYKIIDLAVKIKKLFGSGEKIVFKHLPKDDPTRRKPDISKAKRVLGWYPKVKIDEGLKKTAEYYQSLK